MKFKKEISKKTNEAGKSQLLVRVDVSRTVRPRLKTGIFVHRSLFDEESQTIMVPRQCRRNAELVDESSKCNFLLQQFCVRVETLCEEAANGKGIEITNEWLHFKLNPLVRQNKSLTNPILTESELKRRFPKYVMDELEKETEEAAPLYESQDFYKLINQYCGWNRLSYSRTRCYKTLARMLRRFELYQQATNNSSFVLNFDAITTEDLEDFRVYVRQESELAQKHPKLFKQLLDEAPYTSNKFKPKKIVPRGDNYITCVMKKISAVFHWLHKIGKTDNDPFHGFNVGREQFGEPIYLTKQERDKLFQYDLSGESLMLQQQRDIFVFQCLVGCRVGDLVTLTPLNVQDGVLEYAPSKTRKNQSSMKVIRVPLHESALSLIEKYKGVDKKGRLFPFISTQRYNDYIKEAFRTCGIVRVVQWMNPLTGNYEPRRICDIVASHMARKTFIGVAYRLTKDPCIIGKMTGHVEGSKAFSHYRRIDDEITRSVISMM